MGTDIVRTVIVGVWAILPAYAPNSIAVVVGGGVPIDGGRRFRGARLLGDGKTWRGFVGGVLGGFVVASVMAAVRPVLTPWLPPFPFVVRVALPFGAMFGDLAGSFLKRRTGRERGAAFPGVDQYGFVVGALGLSLLVAPVWTVGTFTPPVFGVVVVLTPLVHLGTNAGAYVLGLKHEPW